MSVYGVTPAGFVAKPYDVIKQEIDARFRAALGAGLDLSPQSPEGQLAAIMADREASLWDLAEDVAASFDPDKATGAALVALSALTGTIPESPRKSTAVVRFSGTTGTNIPAGRIVSVSGNPSARFITTAAGTVAAGIADVAAEAVEYGPTVAPAGSLTVLETPVAGITGVTNPLDAVVGANAETDDALRRRREDEVNAGGAASSTAIRAAVLDVDGVTACTIFENDADATDADGVPPHAVEVMVSGGADAAIAAAIFASKSAGITTHGGVSTLVTDAEGGVRTIKHSRPAALDTWLTYSVTVNAKAWPSDGVAQLQAAAVAAGGLLASGQDVIRSAFLGAAFQVPGVVDVTALTLGFAASPVGTANLAVTTRQRAVFDTSRIVVNVTTVPGVP